MGSTYNQKLEMSPMNLHKSEMIRFFQNSFPSSFNVPGPPGASLGRNPGFYILSLVNSLKRVISLASGFSFVSD